MVFCLLFALISIFFSFSHFFSFSFSFPFFPFCVSFRFCFVLFLPLFLVFHFFFSVFYFPCGLPKPIFHNKKRVLGLFFLPVSGLPFSPFTHRNAILFFSSCHAPHTGHQTPNSQFPHKTPTQATHQYVTSKISTEQNTSHEGPHTATEKQLNNTKLFIHPSKARTNNQPFNKASSFPSVVGLSTVLWVCSREFEFCLMRPGWSVDLQGVCLCLAHGVPPPRRFSMLQFVRDLLSCLDRVAEFECRVSCRRLYT